MDVYEHWIEIQKEFVTDNTLYKYSTDRTRYFEKKEFTEKELLERVKDCTIPFLLVRDRSTRRCYEIPDCEMLEFRAVCDPNYKGTLYVDTVTAEARPGQAVRVIRGPFAGLEGKLTQYKKSYYVVVTLATIGVMLHIPKWYCEKIN